MSPILDAANTLATDAKGLTALHHCTTKEEAEALLKLGLDIGAKDVAGATPLHYASSDGHTEVVAALLAAGADVNAKSSTDWTPLHCACNCGRLEIAQTLITAGADVNARNSGVSTPLHYACINGHLKIAEALIEAGADVDPRNSAGWTPLHYACRLDCLKVSEGLIAAGADVNIRNSEGKTPLDVCKTDEMKALFKPDTAKIIPLPSAIAPARTISADEIRLFHAMLENAELIARAAVAQGDSESGLRRATTLHETALGFVKDSVENLTVN